MKDFADDIDRASSLAQIAQAVYDPTKVKTADWQRVTQSELSELNLSEAFSKIKKSGVVSGLYRNQKGDYALSFAGTDFGKIKDIRANLRQGLGLESQQYTDSIKLAKAVREEVKGNLMITGHSKGGGQAIIAGSVTGAQTVTFNPAGVHEKTFAREGLNKSAVNDFAMRTGQIQNFIAKGELLDKVNGLPLIPSAIGQEVDLVSDTMKTKLLSGHSIKHVINLLQERKINLATNSIQHAQQTVSSSKADIGRDILQSYNNVVKQNAPIATLREAITKGYKKSLDNSIDGFAFYGPNAPKELGAAATLNPGLTAELMTAQAAVRPQQKLVPRSCASICKRNLLYLLWFQVW